MKPAICVHIYINTHAHAPTHTSIDGQLVAVWEYCEKFIYITVADINVMAWALCTPLPLLLMSGKKRN